MMQGPLVGAAPENNYTLGPGPMGKLISKIAIVWNSVCASGMVLRTVRSEEGTGGGCRRFLYMNISILFLSPHSSFEFTFACAVQG
jgi:hypothetical protein